MNRSLGRALAVLCGLALCAVSAVTACAQASEVKEKPPMYTYVGFWNIPRPQWAEMDKSLAGEKATLEKAVAGGTLVAYGDDQTLVHTADGDTHDSWWSAMSMAGVLNVLDQFYKTGTPTSPVLASATKHSDAIFVSTYYNWHAGSWKNVYSHAGYYKLKPDASPDALEHLSKHMVAPLLEKLLSEGVIHEYEIDTEAIHTESSDAFWIEYIAASAEGLDKVNAALTETLKANPTFAPAFASATEGSAHRDYLVRTNATYK